MSLAPGTQLGPYQITALLAAGGMGEVYRARDTRLDRTVAIKILPTQFSADAVHKQRFEREAKAISNLNHPNICVLHDIGQQDGIDFLVMEYVEGETLTKRLERGTLPLEQVLKYGAQIADALDKAHRKSIIHRDLKPGNIMLTASGAKLLDFGLAKPAAPLAELATLTATNEPVTEQGAIVGTFQYMSPEQVEGKELDGRSDIFSLGAVLYEMVTEQKAFEGKSQLSTASAILEKDPKPISTIKPTTPPLLDHLIRRCLAKDPEERWQTARDLTLELKWIAEAGAQSVSPTIGARGPSARERLAWVSAALITFIAVGLALAYFNKPSAEMYVVRSAILPPENGAFVFNGAEGAAVLSPDGRNVVFLARVDKVARLWVRTLDSFAVRPLTGTEGATSAFWSPDSRNIGYFAQGKLKRIAASGGPSQTLCEADSIRGGSWGQKDVIIFSRVAGEIYRVPASGGTPQPVTTLNASRGELTHRWPFFLPDGIHFLFLASPLGTTNESNVFYLGSLDKKDTKLLFHGSSPIIYAMGHVLYLDEKVLMARPFNLSKLDFTGDAFPIAEDVQFDPIFSNGIFSASQNGVLLYQQGNFFSAYSLTVFDRQGKQLSRIGEPGPYFAPHFSPDGKRLLYAQADPRAGKIDLWIRELASGQLTLVTSDPRPLSPIWSPDGERVAYSVAKGGAPAIYMKPASTVGVEQELWKPKEGLALPSDWTPDGKFLILSERLFTTGKSRLALLSVARDAGPVPIVEVVGANVDSGRVSPDGKWIAYRSDESGRSEISISSFPRPTGKLQVSLAGGSVPRWRGDGKELYYVTPDNTLMVAETKQVNGSLRVVATKALFRTAGTLTATQGSQYDVTPDGNRFLVDALTSDQTSAPLNLVMNWTSDIKNK